MERTSVKRAGTWRDTPGGHTQRLADVNVMLRFTDFGINFLIANSASLSPSSSLSRILDKLFDLSGPQFPHL